MSYCAVVVLLGLLIFIHEFGHFLAARLLGLPVARFSLGLGPVVWRRRLGRTEYCLSSIPFGGYVLLDLADPAAYLRLPLGARLIFSACGPLANLLVALVCYAVLGGMLHGGTWQQVVVAPFVATWRDVLATFGALGGLFHQADQLSGVVASWSKADGSSARARRASCFSPPGFP